MILILPAIAFADVQLHFEWDPNVEPDIAGYRVFSRPDNGEYDYSDPAWEGEESFCSLFVDGAATHFFVVRAFDLDGFESDDSNEVMYTGDEASADHDYQVKDAVEPEEDTIHDLEANGCFIASSG